MLDEMVILGGMLVLRLGVPVLATILLCHTLERVSARRAAQLAGRRKAREAATAKQVKVVRQLHCWEIKRCDEETRQTCPAHQRQNVPCWLALQLAGQPLSDECRSCALYDLRLVA